MEGRPDEVPQRGIRTRQRAKESILAGLDRCAGAKQGFAKPLLHHESPAKWKVDPMKFLNVA
jgi:hypothetical protein